TGPATVTRRQRPGSHAAGLGQGPWTLAIAGQADVPAGTLNDTIQRTSVTGTSSIDTTVSGTGVIVVELVPPADAQWPTFHNDKRRHGESPSTHVPPMKELWRTAGHQLALWTGPVVADNIVYSTTLDGYIRAYDPFTGDVIWEQALGDSFYYTGIPAVDRRTPDPNDNVVYATFY